MNQLKMFTTVCSARLPTSQAAARLAAGDLGAARVEQFAAACRVRGQRRVPTLAGVAMLLEHLTELGVIDASSPPAQTERDELLADYSEYLLGGRGLTPVTVLRYVRFAKRFLAQRASRTGGVLGCEGLTSGELNDYLLAASARLVVESAKREAADLRALLQFLYLRQVSDTNLAAALPPVAAWRGTRLPRGLSCAEVEALLQSCDRTTPSGRRD